MIYINNLPSIIPCTKQIQFCLIFVIRRFFDFKVQMQLLARLTMLIISDCGK